MKKAAKLIIIMAIALIVTVIAGTSAFAAYYDTQADSLNELGLFRGTDNGYELDQPSTRAQAAVMLVRMLGKEAEVLAGSFSDPFTDVPKWAENYIGYMYENGLTQGTSATTFGSDENCTAQMYTSFVLRALGYSEESGDFTYAQAQDFATEIGLACISFSPDTFLRDDMAALSYSALFQNLNGSDTILLEALVSENTVDAAAAEKYLAYFGTYQDYLADSSKADQSMSLRISSVSNINVTMGDVLLRISQTTDSAIVFEDNDFIMKQVSVSEYGDHTESTSYYSDGWLYFETEGIKDVSERTKYKYEYPVDFAALIEEAGMKRSADPFYLISSIEKFEDSSGVRYAMAYSKSAMNEVLGAALSGLSSITYGMELQFNSLVVTVDYDTDGNTAGMTMLGDISYSITSEGQLVSLEVTIDMVSTILETGDSVTVTLPDDLDDYEELDLFPT